MQLHYGIGSETILYYRQHYPSVVHRGFDKNNVLTIELYVTSDMTLCENNTIAVIEAAINRYLIGNVRIPCRRVIIALLQLAPRTQRVQ